MRTDMYDIAIIGAGPGGCACALALQGSGLRVVLIDKDEFPRDKTCGDAIPGAAFKAMDGIKPEWGQLMRQFLHKADIQSAKAFPPNGISVLYHWVTYSYNSKRIDFDNFLFQLVRTETDTVILENRRLQKVIIENETVECTFQDSTGLGASLVIGCDGANSVVARQLGNLDFRSDHTGTAVSAYFRDVGGVEKGVNEFHFFKEFLHGYFWIFPLQNGWSNVGFGLLPNSYSKRKKPMNLRESFTMITTTFPGIAHRFQYAESTGLRGFSLPLGTHKRPVSGERFMLCGDAAALIDPLGGHGIDNSMWSGLLAAKQAIRCFQSSDFTAGFISKYDRDVYAKLGAKLRRGSFVIKLIKRFPLLVNYLSWIAQSQKLAKYIVRILKI